jgi:hypothetical protein
MQTMTTMFYWLYSLKYRQVQSMGSISKCKAAFQKCNSNTRERNPKSCFAPGLPPERGPCSRPTARAADGPKHSPRPFPGAEGSTVNKRFRGESLDYMTTIMDTPGLVCTKFVFKILYLDG